MLYTAFILGLLGSFHCVGMCGPIAFLLPLDRKNRAKRNLQLVVYHLGRITTYALLGVLIGAAGKSLNLFGVQQQLTIGIGVIMILAVLIPYKKLGSYRFSQPMYRFVGKLKNSFGSKLQKKSLSSFYTLGFLNGLLPCGLVYIAVFGALASAEIWHGALYMSLFGLGTVPLMTAAIFLGNFLKLKARQRILKLIPVFVCVLGALFILRGLGLGIPYVSPSEMVAVEKVTTEHECH